MAKGSIILIPIPLGEPFEAHLATIPQYVIDAVHQLDAFVVERAKTARHFIKATQPPYPLSNVTVFEIDETTKKVDFKAVEAILQSGKNVGLMSEAGCPGVADPGAEIVAWAHQRDYLVQPLVGPNSILLALMGSGMNGQSFAFQGYLSAKRDVLARDLKRLEDLARKHQQTQIVIETPYRNRQFVETALATLSSTTKLCIAADLSLPPQYLVTKTVAEWKKTAIPDLHKRPAIFLIGT